MKKNEDRAPEEPSFKRISREVIVENAWHRYCVDRYRLKGGAEGSYYYIDMPGSCGIIPLFDDGSTLLIKVTRYLLGVSLWEFPIGGMKEGQDPLDCAHRELREEAGFVAQQMELLGSFAPYKGVSNEICHFFLARGLTEVGQELEASEEISVKRLSLEDAQETLMQQEILDGQSLCGLMLLTRYLQSHGVV